MLEKLGYNKDNDKLIHVGDLVAKGDMNDEVMEYMAANRIVGVRGNHDQPVSCGHRRRPVRVTISGRPMAYMDGMGRWR